MKGVLPQTPLRPGRLAPAGNPWQQPPIDSDRLFYKKFIPLRWTDVNSRIFSFWRDKGLVWGVEAASEKKEREWVRLNITDYVYVRLVATMRQFGMPLETISEVRTKLFAESEMDSHEAIPPYSLLPYSGSLYEKGRRNQPGGAMLNNPAGILNKVLYSVLYHKEEIALNVFSDGYCYFERPGAESNYKKRGPAARLEIPINELLYDLTLRIALDRQTSYSLLASEDEVEILQFVSSGKVRSAEILGTGKGKVTLDFSSLCHHDLVNLIRKIKSPLAEGIALQMHSGNVKYYTLKYDFKP